MKLLDESRGQIQTRAQDDAAVGYGFQRHPGEVEFPHYDGKQSRWASGDDAIIEVTFSPFFISISIYLLDPQLPITFTESR